MSFKKLKFDFYYGSKVLNGNNKRKCYDKNNKNKSIYSHRFNRKG